MSGHIAVAAEQAGHGPVAIVDMDPMGSLAAWWNARSAETRVYAGVGEGGLPATLAQLRHQGIGLVVIDTPPFASAEIAAIVHEADLVVVPVVPSPHDLRAIGETIEIVEAQNKPMVFCVNNASTNGALTIQAVTALSQHGTVADTILHSRQDFRSEHDQGPRGRRGVSEREISRRRWQISGNICVANSRRRAGEGSMARQPEGLSLDAGLIRKGEARGLHPTVATPVPRGRYSRSCPHRNRP